MKEMDRLQESTVLAVGIAKHKELPTRPNVNIKLQKIIKIFQKS